MTLTSIQNSFDLLAFLKAQNLLDSSPPLWWKNAGTFEVVVGAILTQNTNWKNVELSLESLTRLDLLGLESIANCDLIKRIFSAEVDSFAKFGAKYFKRLWRL